MRISLFFASFVSLFCTTSAHTIFQTLWVNGISQGHLTGIRVPDYNGPIMDVDSDDMICNGGINPYHQPISQNIIDVPAGAQVTAEWHHELVGANPTDPSDPVDPSHHGPMMVYLAKVSDATQATVTDLKWFKIYHDGLTNGVWAVDKLITNKGKLTFSIPSCIESGQYLLRVELLALHAAETYPGAQFYMECAQINVTGGSGSVTPTAYTIPGIYKGTDPGVTVNIYTGLTSYVIPGPSVFSCSGSPSGTTTVPSTTTKPATTTNPVTSTKPTTTTTSPGSTVPQFGQCGGEGYTGPTSCVSPYICQKQNDWYSQCL